MTKIQQNLKEAIAFETAIKHPDLFEHSIKKLKDRLNLKNYYRFSEIEEMGYPERHYALLSLAHTFNLNYKEDFNGNFPSSNRELQILSRNKFSTAYHEACEELGYTYRRVPIGDNYIECGKKEIRVNAFYDSVLFSRLTEEGWNQDRVLTWNINKEDVIKAVKGLML